MTHYLTWAEIDLKAIRHNIRVLRRRAGRTKLLAVVKADAYGHGMVASAKLLVREGVAFLGVFDTQEGIALRKAGLKVPVLVFESALPAAAADILRYNLTPTVCTLELASKLNALAQKRGKTLGVHVKVDTGMGRLGVWHKDARDFIRRLRRFKHLKIEGLYTHFPSADTNPAFTGKQIRQFAELVRGLRKDGIQISYLHAANSMGLAAYASSVLNLARPGLMVYGLSPKPGIKSNLRPALSVYSRVTFLKALEKGRGVSYGRTFVAAKKMTVATIPIGYNDGYFRAFSNKACVLIGGRRCAVLGRVTMDQIVVDVSRVKGARLGMPVVILGKQGRERISADELAGLAQTINYEIVCSLGNRLPKVYKK